MGKTLTEHLQKLKDQQQGIFVPYIMAGDHEKGLAGLQETIQFLEDLGVSAIEVGIPFSDPVADGPVIEEAGLRSLENFFRDVEGTAVKGVIIPDLPHEHANLVEPLLADKDIALVPLVSLTTGIERQKKLIHDAEGFIYAVAVNGVTGKAGSYRDDLDHHLAQLHEIASIPVLTGFGVSSMEDVHRFNKVSDGVIVGSKIVKALHQGETDAIARFISQAVKG